MQEKTRNDILTLTCIYKSLRTKDKRNMTPFTYKRCVYPDICLLLSLVYKHPCLPTHTNENFRKQYE